MTKGEMQQYLRRWEAVHQAERALRQAELGKLYLPDVMRMFESAFRKVIQEVPPRISSGLVDQQAILAKLHNG